MKPKSIGITLTTVFMATLFALGIAEYITIVGQSYEVSPANNVALLSDLAIESFFPALIAILASALWKFYFDRTFEGKKRALEDPVNATIEQRLKVARYNVVVARQGSASDTVFFMGLMVAAIGAFLYIVLVLTNLSPVRALFF